MSFRIDDIAFDTLKNSVNLTAQNNIFLNVSPNPVSSYSELNYHLNKTSSIDISIFDLTGRKVMQLPSIESASGDGAIPFDVDNLPNGMYYLKFEAGGNIQMQKIIVQH